MVSISEVSLRCAVGAFIAVALVITALSMTAHVAAAAADERISTTFIIDRSTPTDLYEGDQVTITGRLVDADGNGIPDQTVTLKSMGHAMGQSRTLPDQYATTDSTGGFTLVLGPITADMAITLGMPSFVKTVQLEAWMEYAGNDVYQPTSIPHEYATVHFA